MTLLKTFEIEIYDDPQLCLKQGSDRGYYITIEGLLANIESTVRGYLQDKGLLDRFEDKTKAVGYLPHEININEEVEEFIEEDSITPLPEM